MPRVPLSTTGGYHPPLDTVNWLPLASSDPGSRTPDECVQPPGLRPFAPVLGGAVRELHNVEGKLFGVGGTTLYRIKGDVVVPYGSIPGTSRVSMAHNAANELLTVNGSAGYLLNTQTLALDKITDDGYPGAVMAGFVDQYFPQVEPNGRFWFWSDLNDGSAYNTLDRAEAEADPDRIVSLIVSHREVLIFGRDTIEPFINTGAATGTFQRAANTVIECGCSARLSVAGMDNAVFFLDDKRIVRVLRGVTPERISTEAVEKALSECTQAEIQRAFALTWEDRGHKVYYLTVPGRFTLGYDLLSGKWHRRQSPGMNTWRLTALEFWEGQWIGGDAEGNLYTLDWDYFYDGLEELPRERIVGTLHADQRRVTVNRVELLFRVEGEGELGEFPENPEPPTIAGDAPDSLSGDAYSYSYTLGAGTPPYTVTLRSGTLPPGVTLSSAGVLSGVPTTAGDYTWTVRNTDVNGMWDDLDDEASIDAHAWFAGQVALNGASGGSESYYKRAASPQALLTATPRALPAQGSGAITRFSSCNGKLFMHRVTAACVSSNMGGSWTACDTSLSVAGVAEHDVQHNGTKFYCFDKCSVDGETWTAIPNLPATAIVRLARPEDGLIVVQDTSGVMYTSVDAGANWITADDFGSGVTYRPATDGDRIAAASSNNFMFWSDDLLQTTDGGTADNGFGVWYANGAWLSFCNVDGGGGVGVGLRRCTDGESWLTPAEPASLVLFVNGEYFDTTQLATDGAGTWVAWIAQAGAPNERHFYISTDDGETWESAGTLYGSALGLTYVEAV